MENNDNNTPKTPPILALENKKKASKKEEIQPEIPLADTLIIDTTAAEQKIKYPTDLDLLNKVRVLTEGFIDAFHKAFPSGDKPRTYRNIARKCYLNAALKKKKSGKEVRKAIKKQLGFIDRNIHNINKLWDNLLLNNIRIPFSKVEFKKWLVCQVIYRQQLQMIVQNVRSCEHRIVSIDQPHVRAIPRGKAGKNIEFGAKISIDVDGNIKNCPSQSMSYGNHSEVSFMDVLFSGINNFKDIWSVTKDQIDICNVCEFRYMCSDCRIYTENATDSYSKPSKCNYNPYTGLWKN